MEDISLATFTEQYCTVNVPEDESKRKEDSNPIYPFVPSTGYYDHPSVLKSGQREGQCSRGLTERDQHVLFRVPQWMFPDTAAFKADIFKCDESQFNVHMELYAQIVLSLFMPHRSSTDLKETTDSTYQFAK